MSRLLLRNLNLLNEQENQTYEISLKHNFFMNKSDSKK